MVIRKIRIQNYTSHQDTTIEFDKLVTSIVGFSDQGKTNVFHALRTVLFAEDWPVTDIRDYQDRAEIRVWMWDGRSVRDVRTHKSREISLILPNGLLHGDKLIGNKDARERVEEFTGIRKVQVDPEGVVEDINFVQVDEEAPLTGQPETVQRRVLSVVGGSSLELGRVRLVARKKELDVKAGTLSEKLQASRQIQETLEVTIASTEPLYEELETIQEKLKGLKQTTDIMNKFLSVNNAHLTYSTRVELTARKERLTALQDLHATWGSLLIKQQKYKELVEKIRKTSVASESLQTAVRVKKEELEQLREQLAQFSVCTVCGRPL